MTLNKVWRIYKLNLSRKHTVLKLYCSYHFMKRGEDKLFQLIDNSVFGTKHGNAIGVGIEISTSILNVLLVTVLRQHCTTFPVCT